MSSNATHRIPPSLPTHPEAWRDWTDVPPSGAANAERSPCPPEGISSFDLEQVNALYREVFEAQQVQRRLSGLRSLRRGQFEIASEIFPVQHFSGDFVCIFDRGDSTMVALGDVAGKGLTAAMWSTHVMSLIRTYSASLGAPSAVLSAINRDLCTLASGVPITTMVLAQLDWQRGELTYSNAGHFPPFIRRANGAFERLSTGGPALAAIPSARFEQAKVQLSVSDMLAGYSDGLIECRNAEDEEFGVERLLAQLRRSGNLTAGQTLFSMIGVVQDFSQGVRRADDLTLLIVTGRGKFR